MMTRVFPDPAPARMRRGPSVWRTASRWGGFSSARYASGCTVIKGQRKFLSIRVRLCAGGDEGARWERARFRSLHSDALGEIAGLIDIAPLADGDVVGEQLQRHHHEDRGEMRSRCRDGDAVIDQRAKFGVASRTHG